MMTPENNMHFNLMFDYAGQVNIVLNQQLEGYGQECGNRSSVKRQSNLIHIYKL